MPEKTLLLDSRPFVPFNLLVSSVFIAARRRVTTKQPFSVFSLPIYPSARPSSSSLTLVVASAANKTLFNQVRGRISTPESCPGGAG